MVKAVSIVWFRSDLRLEDNPAFNKATETDVLPIYIYDDSAPKPFRMGEVSQVRLHHSLVALDRSLDGALHVYSQEAPKVIQDLCKRFTICGVYANRCFEPWYRKQEESVAKICQEMDVDFELFNGQYLWHPEQVLKDDGSFYRVFSAYKRRAWQTPKRAWVMMPDVYHCFKDVKHKTTIDDLALLPKHPWHQTVVDSKKAGEEAAQNQFADFLEQGLFGYKDKRNHPALPNVSRLSDYLHFGEISVRSVWEEVDRVASERSCDVDREHFLSELTWREFSAYLLYHIPTLHTDNIQKHFDRFPWRSDAALLEAWQRGQTGYPIVDAGMRELWQTGYMHNRVRMVVASFLVKNLSLHWHHGRDWFWDCLQDADLANNSASWQWVAGCGVDAAPYFRIFNPITQGEKFDPDGIYTLQFVPELKNMPKKYLFKPWLAPDDVLKDAGVVLGQNYPKPIIDVATSRQAALAAYKSL